MPHSHSQSSLESIEETLPPMEAIRTNQGSKSQKGAETANELHLVQSHLSHHDMPVTTEFREVDAEQYLRFSPARKVLIVFLLSFCSFLAPISSTSILSGIPEVAKTYNTSGSVINASNALYLAFMGVSAPFWGPFSQVWGRRPVSIYLWMFSILVIPIEKNKCANTKSLDLPCKRFSILRFQHWHCSGTKFTCLLHLPSVDSLPRNVLPSCRQLCPW
jgi:hypothetical protein